MAFLFKRGNGYWYIGYYEKSYTNGKPVLIRKNESTKTKSKMTANRVYNDFSIKKKNLEVNKILCSDFINRYLDVSCYSKDLKQKNNIRQKFNFLINHMKDKFIDEYTTEEIDSLLTMKLNSRSVYTARNYRAELRAAFEQAKRWKYISSNPVKDCINIKLPEPNIITFGKTEIEIFLKLAGSVYGDIFIFTLYTGVRVGDLVNIKLSDIDLQARIITLGNDEHIPKNRKTNFIEIADGIIDIIQKYIMINQVYLFESKLKKKYSTHTITNAFYRIIKKAKLKRGLNHKALRKTFATTLYNSNVDISEVSKLLHHSSERVTKNHYAKLLKGNYTGITNKISNLFNKAV